MISAEITCTSGEVLFRDGEAASHCYIVVSGEIDIQHVMNNDEVRTVDTRVPGDLIVWSALVHPYKTTATGVARHRVELIAIEAARLRKLCEKDTKLGFSIMSEVARVMSHRLMGARVQLATLS